MALVVFSLVAGTAFAADLPTTDDLPNGISRLAGENRYDTSVQIAKTYSAPVDQVVVAAGTDFPDALSASATGSKGPVLLTSPKELPQTVAEEIKRLQPKTIFIAGGNTSVSSGVAEQLRAIAPIKRLGGQNRYETSLNIQKELVGQGEEIFVATGESFPDALAAGAIAGTKAAPVILVPGSADSVDAQSIKNSTGANQAYIVGGTASVSSGIEAALGGYMHVERISGQDRFLTATQLNGKFYGNGPETVFLATGASFPDALAGGALAGAIGAPLFVTNQSCNPKGVFDVLNTKPGHVVMLGGSASLADAVGTNTLCAPTPAPAPAPKPDVYYENCTDVWNAIGRPLTKSDPGYETPRLDRDGDGVACERDPRR